MDAISEHPLDRLHAALLSARRGDSTSPAHRRLMARPTRKLAQKVGEEAVETAIEAVRGKSGRLVEESADLLTALAALWADAGIEPRAVWAELAKREGVRAAGAGSGSEDRNPARR